MQAPAPPGIIASVQVDRNTNEQIELQGQQVGLTSGPIVLECRALSKRYGDVIAVDEVSFSLARGTVTGFLGPNGGLATSGSPTGPTPTLAVWSTPTPTRCGAPPPKATRWR